MIFLGLSYFFSFSMIFTSGSSPSTVITCICCFLEFSFLFFDEIDKSVEWRFFNESLFRSKSVVNEAKVLLLIHNMHKNKVSNLYFIFFSLFFF